MADCDAARGGRDTCRPLSGLLGRCSGSTRASARAGCEWSWLPARMRRWRWRLCGALAALGFVATRARCLPRRDTSRRHAGQARRRARADRLRAAGAHRAVRARRASALAARGVRRRSCSDWRRRCRSRSWRPRSPSHWQPRRSTSRGDQSRSPCRGRAAPRSRSCPGSRSIFRPRRSSPAVTRARPSASRLAGQRGRPRPLSKRGEMNGHPSRRSCRLVLVAVAAILVALAVVPAAGAHARLITTEPANDAVLEQSPRFVLLRFDEPVETAFGAIRVYDDARASRRLGQGRAAEREGSPDPARTRPRSRHVHRDVARRVRGRASRLGGVRLPRRRSGCEPGRRCGTGARRWDATVGDGRVLDRPGTRLPASAPRGRRDVDAGRRSRASAPLRHGRGCRASLRRAPAGSP